jgi:hypothetical protein
MEERVGDEVEKEDRKEEKRDGQILRLRTDPRLKSSVYRSLCSRLRNLPRVSDGIGCMAIHGPKTIALVHVISGFPIGSLLVSSVSYLCL